MLAKREFNIKGVEVDWRDEPKWSVIGYWAHKAQLAQALHNDGESTEPGFENVK